MIGFLQPLALLGLLAAAIPALLHLMARRVPPTVSFPAARYIAETERVHSRRLKLRNLILMLLRMSVIVFLVLGAARPVVRLGGGLGSSHPPTDIAIVLDNSLSSSAVIDGRLLLDGLVDQARAVLAAVLPDDRLWLVVADGVPRRIGIPAAEILLDSLKPAPVRLDLGRSVRAAARAVCCGELPQQEIVLLSDLQSSALSSGGHVDVPVLVWLPPHLPENRGIDSVRVEPRVWSPEGDVVVSVTGGASAPTTVRMIVRGVETARAVVSSDDEIVLPGRAVPLGWSVAEIVLDPDELRADDRVKIPLLVAEPAAATATSAVGVFVTRALDVLRSGGRVRVGDEVVLDVTPGSSRTIVFPPSDPALVGATNRALERAGAVWRFGDEVSGEWLVSGAVGLAQGTAVYRLRRLIGEGTVLAAAGTEPWIVHDGNLVLVASRMEEPWTELPVTAAFVPFVDLLVNRLASREAWLQHAHPGEQVELPASASTISTSEGIVPIASDRPVWMASQPGVYFLRGEAGDTVGALAVTHDPRESRAERATESMLRATFGDVTLAEDDEFEASLFRSARGLDLTTFLLVTALIAAVTELGVATAIGRR